MKKVILLIMAVLLLPAAMWGESIFFGNGISNDFGGVSIPAPAGTTFPAGPAGGGGMSVFSDFNLGTLTALNFTTATAGTLDIFLLDCCIVGDVYEIIVDGISAGITTPVPLNGPALSQGAFSILIGAGAHTIDVWDIVLSYDGVASPFGGGIVQGMSPAGWQLQADFAPVPEPASLMLLGTGLIGLAGRARKLIKR